MVWFSFSKFSSSFIFALSSAILVSFALNCALLEERRELKTKTKPNITISITAVTPAAVIKNEGIGLGFFFLFKGRRLTFIICRPVSCGLILWQQSLLVQFLP